MNEKNEEQHTSIVPEGVYIYVNQPQSVTSPFVTTVVIYYQSSLRYVSRPQRNTSHVLILSCSIVNTRAHHNGHGHIPSREVRRAVWISNCPLLLPINASDCLQ